MWETLSSQVLAPVSNGSLPRALAWLRGISDCFARLAQRLLTISLHQQVELWLGKLTACWHQKADVVTVHPCLDKMYVVNQSRGVNDACVIVHDYNKLSMIAALNHGAGMIIRSAVVLKSVALGSAT